MTTKKQLESLWDGLTNVSASTQAKIDLAVRTGESRISTFRPQLRGLLTDRDPQVRYYALQALVIDLHDHDPEVIQACWSFLACDPDEDVRSMAATCLGSIHFASGDRQTFDRLVEVLEQTRQSPNVRLSTYVALFQVAGRKPEEWPGFRVPWRQLKDIQVDWQKVAELRANSIDRDQLK